MPDLTLPRRLPPAARDPGEHPHGTFGTVAMLIPPPVRFPRDAMRPALDVHARLLREHLHVLLHELVTPEGAESGMPFMWMSNWTPILFEQGDGRVLLQLRRRQGASWVVRRCHGITRELMELPASSDPYVVVIARGVASLHRLRGTGEPRSWTPDKRYSYEGLGLKVVGPPIIAEPWEQWHLRRSSRMTTYWQLPDGTRGQGEVEVPSEPRTVHERVERTLAFHADRIAQEHEDAVRERGGERNLVCIVNTRLRGFRASVFPHCAAFVETFVTAKHPMIRRLATRTERGFDPVYVRVDHGGGLRWVARRRGEDLQVPRPVDERDEGEGE